MNKDERRNARIRRKPECNLTLSFRLNKVPNCLKNLSKDIILAHLNQKHFRASKFDNAEVQVVSKVTGRF
jgi:hypothetical protein